MPVAVVKLPPTNTRESATAIALTVLFTVGAHEVSVPVESSAARRVRTDPPSMVNAPPTNAVEPAAATVETEPSAPGFQLSSAPEESANAARRSRPVAEPPTGVTDVKAPPTTSSSPTVVIAETEPFSVGAKSRSAPVPPVPTAPIDARGFAAPTPPDMVVNEPPT